MLVIDLLLYSKEIGEGVVERTFDVSTVSPAVTDATCKRPSVVADARAKGVHRPYCIAAVSPAEGEFVAARHVRGAEIIVVTSSHARHAEGRVLEGKGKVNVTCHVVDTAHQRVAELSRFHVIHWCTIDIHIIEFLIERTIAESHGRKEVSHLTCIHIVA